MINCLRAGTQCIFFSKRKFIFLSGMVNSFFVCSDSSHVLIGHSALNIHKDIYKNMYISLFAFTGMYSINTKYILQVSSVFQEWYLGDSV